MITHIEKLKTQLFKFFEKYQKYFNFLHELHSHFCKTMLRNRFEIFFRKKLKKLIRRFEHTEVFFDEKKIRDFDSNKIKEIFFSINSQMLITSIKMTICKIRSIKTNRKIKENDVNIVKNEVKKTKLRTKKLKN